MDKFYFMKVVLHIKFFFQTKVSAPCLCQQSSVSVVRCLGKCLNYNEECFKDIYLFVRSVVISRDGKL